MYPPYVAFPGCRNSSVSARKLLLVIENLQRSANLCSTAAGLLCRLMTMATKLDLAVGQSWGNVGDVTPALNHRWATIPQLTYMTYARNTTLQEQPEVTAYFSSKQWPLFAFPLQNICAHICWWRQLFGPFIRRVSSFIAHRRDDLCPALRPRPGIMPVSMEPRSREIRAERPDYSLHHLFLAAVLSNL